ncbi:MAG: DUF4112 domain-containing protein [Gemmatimonadota bacterium]
MKPVIAGEQPRTSQATNTSLERIRRLAWLLDNSIPIPGTSVRIGLDPIVGLIPGLGDLAGAFFSGYIVVAAAKLGASRSTIFRMLWNVLIELVIGMVPVVGDLFDAGWKANAKNIALLERSLENNPLSTSRDRGFVVALGAAITLLLGSGLISAYLLIRWLMSL